MEPGSGSRMKSYCYNQRKENATVKIERLKTLSNFRIHKTERFLKKHQNNFNKETRLSQLS